MVLFILGCYKHLYAYNEEWLTRSLAAETVGTTPPLQQYATGYTPGETSVPFRASQINSQRSILHSPIFFGKYKRSVLQKFHTEITASYKPDCINN